MRRLTLVALSGIALLLFVLIFLWRNDPDQSFAQEASSQNSSPAPSKQGITTTTLGKASLHSAPAQQGTLEEYLKRSDSVADWRVHRDALGRVTSFSGGLIRINIQTPKKAYEFLREISPLLKLDPDQMVYSQNQLPANPDSPAHKFEQTYDRYTVFGREVILFSKNSWEGVYYVTNEAVPLTDVDTRIAFNIEDAERAVIQKMKPQEVIIEKSGSQPVVVVQDPPQGILCWQIQVRVRKPSFQRRLLLVSVRDLQFVRNIDLLVKN
jgi:hypothetical protein